MIPAMTTGTIHFIMRSGRRTPIAAIPTPDLEVPYDAPMPDHFRLFRWKVGRAVKVGDWGKDEEGSERNLQREEVCGNRSSRVYRVFGIVHVENEGVSERFKRENRGRCVVKRKWEGQKGGKHTSEDDSSSATPLYHSEEWVSTCLTIARVARCV